MSNGWQQTSILAEKIPDNVIRHNPGLVRQLLSKEVEGLKVEWASSIRNGWIVVQAKGEDSEVLGNLLVKKYGEVPVQMARLEKWDICRGFVTGAGRVGYGVYVDIGILEPTPKDALYPLHRMRAQLSDGQQYSAREILALNALADNFPIGVVVIGLDGGNITVELDDHTMELFVSWQGHPWDRVNAVGLTHEQAVMVTKRLGLELDIVDIETLSLFVQSFVLKVGTQAPGVISKMGPRLPGVALASYSSHKRLE